MSNKISTVRKSGPPGRLQLDVEQVGMPPRTLNTWKIVVLIIGAMTPLAVIVGTAPLGFAFGGPTTTLAFVAAGLVIGIFCVGYVQMVKRISRPGAFYNYIARGLGRPAGVGGAMIGTVGYIFGFIGASAMGGFVVQDAILALTGVEIPWVILHVAPMLIILALTYRKIDLSAYVVFFIVTLEVMLLLALSITIITRDGISTALPLEVVSPSVFDVGVWSVAFIFAFLCFQGYEAGALYAPEAKNPDKTIPRALYGALAILVLILTFSAWTLTSVSGVETQMEAVLEQGLSGFIFGTVGEYLGQTGVALFSLGSILASSAVTITIGNFMSRYLNGLARDSLLPSYFAKINRHGAPHTALFTLFGLGILVPVLVMGVGGDPRTQLATVAFGVGAIAATSLQAVTSIAVVGYFLKQPEKPSWFKQIIVPSVAGVLLISVLIIQLLGFQWITGSDAGWTTILPFLVFAALVFGIAYGYWLRKNRSEIYADLAAGDSAEEAAAIRADRLAQQTISEQTAS